ncbi:MAG: hypothetical protein M3024_06035 [Candidatus Dormibacteraeota bacterium]|nr:hypothetical protein [Candidatus Dormibacteraeota bacterium]
MRLTALIPEALVLGAAAALLIGPWVLAVAARRWLVPGASVAALAALGVELWLGAQVGALFGGGWLQDRFSLYAKAAVLIGLLVIASVSGWGEERTPRALAAAFLAAFGAMVAASAASLVGLWAGLELAALAGVAGFRWGLAPESWTEAAVSRGSRFLAVSGLTAALTALGFAFVAAFAASTQLTTIAAVLTAPRASAPLAVAVLVLLAALALRVGLAPFQALLLSEEETWPPAAAALGTLVIAAGVIVAARLLASLVGVNAAWAPWFSALAAVAMLWGGLRAAWLRSPRTVAVWLTVQQVGWIAAGLAAHDRRATAAALFLLGCLLPAAAAAPLLAEGVEKTGGWAGLANRDPLRAAAMAAALLSLAGVPLLAGFFGEFTVAAELIRSGMSWLLGVGLLAGILGGFGAVGALAPMVLESGAVAAAAAARRGRGGRPVLVVTVGALAPLVLLAAIGFFANPIHGLALQGAAALGLR